MAETKNKPTDSPIAGPEFTDRVTRLLISCIENLCRFLPSSDPLNGKLQGLLKVLKKAIRYKPVSGLAKEIQDFFNRKKLEEEFRFTEKEEMRQIVMDLTQTIKDFASVSGGLDSDMGKYVEQIDKVNTLQDFIALKKNLVSDLRKIQLSTKDLKRELIQYRNITKELSTRLEQTEAKALIDPLTNVFNRMAYDLSVGQMIREFTRHKEPCALMIIDIDYFKKFNDNYGHKAGDKVLTSVAATIRDAVRDSDSVFRYGGEEFVILLKKIEYDQAKRLAEKVRYEVERDYFVDKEIEMKVTVSLGVSCLKEGDTEQLVFDRADKALYKSKENGRNRVTMA